MSKIFILGLPRTGTTSLCAALLSTGYKVAHTAYTKACIQAADVLADAPIFVDYPNLDRLFPHSKFIYNTRPLETWLPSISTLLNKIKPRITPGAQGYLPILDRCYRHVFGPEMFDITEKNQHLAQCYELHQQHIENYFHKRMQDLLIVDISQKGAQTRIQKFLQLSDTDAFSIPHLNAAGRVNSWNQIKHPNKIDSFAFGTDRRKYYNFESQ